MEILDIILRLCSKFFPKPIPGSIIINSFLKLFFIKSKSELILNLGYSNPVTFNLPSSITAEVENKGTQLTISGPDKELVGEISAQIRQLRKPERYKGKGIRYKEEYIKLKAGKAGGAGAKA